MEEKARARVMISGRVQGVFFRANTRRTAEALGITGWVKNRPDGTVEAILEGNQATVQAMLDWCKTGDPPARVDHLDVTWESFSGNYVTFDVTY